MCMGYIKRIWGKNPIVPLTVQMVVLTYLHVIAESIGPAPTLFSFPSSVMKYTWNTVLRFIYNKHTRTRKRFFLWSLSLRNVNVTMDSLWTHLEAMSLSPQYKRTIRTSDVVTREVNALAGKLCDMSRLNYGNFVPDLPRELICTDYDRFRLLSFYQLVWATIINAVTHSTVRVFFILKKETNLFP